jgi:lactoylglutathione lyase/glyoxylase I family protein
VEAAMTIKVRQVAHVCVFADDLEATRAFYADVLGMEVVFSFLRDGEPFGLYLAAGGRSHIEVFRRADAEADLGRIDHLCLEVEGIDAAIAHVRARGVEVTDKKLGCDDTWQAWVSDPNGVRIELFEYTPQSAQFVGGDRVADW